MSKLFCWMLVGLLVLMAFCSVNAGDLTDSADGPNELLPVDDSSFVDFFNVCFMEDQDSIIGAPAPITFDFAGD